MKKDYIYIGIIALLVVLYFFKPNPVYKQQLKDLQTQVQEQQDKITAKEIVIRGLDSALTVSDKQKNVLESKYQANKPQYVKITKEKLIKDSVINSLSVSELETAIFSRYNNQ